MVDARDLEGFFVERAGVKLQKLLILKRPTVALSLQDFGAGEATLQSRHSFLTKRSPNFDIQVRLK